MKITQAKENNVLVICPEQRLDGITSKLFFDHVKAIIQEGERRILLDLSKLNYMSSAGLRILSLIHATMTSFKGTIVICSAGDNIQELFDLVHLQQLYKMFGKREDALHYFSEGSSPNPNDSNGASSIILSPKKD